MTDDLHNANDLVAKLEELAIHTTQGSFVKLEDVRWLIEKRKEAGAIEQAEAPRPKTLHAAREGAKKFLADQFPRPQPREAGRSISANESQPPSRA